MTESTTEAVNARTVRLDTSSAAEIVDAMCREEATVAAAVQAQRDAIAAVIELVADRLRAGGRLVYVGAGTSGRLGVLDAAECPPTFRTAPEQVIGLIAGGPDAVARSVEGAEDAAGAAARDLEHVALTERDVVVGIAASGRTPYVLEALAFARARNAATVGIVCNRDSPVAAAADLAVVPIVGPEVVAGSTRLKAGTATKMVLNLISTGAMVRLGKVYGNLMVDLQASSDKLRDRARRIVSALTGRTRSEAERLLDACDWEVKTAVVVDRRGVAAREARRMLEAAGGWLRDVIER